MTDEEKKEVEVKQPEKKRSKPRPTAKTTEEKLADLVGKIEELGVSFIFVGFKGPESISFNYSRRGLSAWQLGTVARTLGKIADLEIGEWHIQGRRAEQAQADAMKKKILKPGGLVQ